MKVLSRIHKMNAINLFKHETSISRTIEDVMRVFEDETINLTDIGIEHTTEFFEVFLAEMTQYMDDMDVHKNLNQS
jgi:hypothetical protein